MPASSRRPAAPSGGAAAVHAVLSGWRRMLRNVVREARPQVGHEECAER
jgi:hypothetical protein